MAHVLVIVAQQYNANELWPVLKELKAGGHTWLLTAYKEVIIDEKSRAAFRVNKLLADVPNYEGFDGLIFVSGDPKDTSIHWHDKHLNKLVAQASEAGHPMAAICAAVPSLGPALMGVKVSAFPLRSVLDALSGFGAIHQPVSLYTDRNVATAENEAMAAMWAYNFRCLLEGREPEFSLQPSPFKRKLRERRPIPEVEMLKKARHK